MKFKSEITSRNEMGSSESKVNRYNQGFSKFGPMEQCKDGKWVRYIDYINVFRGINSRLRKYDY